MRIGKDKKTQVKRIENTEEFARAVSSIVLEKKISVSKSRKELYLKNINGKEYKCYAIYYSVGNGRFNIDKSIEDIKWIMKENLN